MTCRNAAVILAIALALWAAIIGVVLALARAAGIGTKW
jgi:hypothetical protein